MSTVPTDTYRHPATGRTVILVGMSHVAAPDFYFAVQADVEGLEAAGAEVHFEGVSAPPADAAMTDQERDLVARLSAALPRAHGQFAELLGLDVQARMTIGPAWRRTDVDMLQLIRAIPNAPRFADDLERIGDLGGQLSACECGRDHSALARRVLRIGFRFGRPIAALVALLPRQAALLRALLDGRNAVAIAAALDAPGDVAALWGAAHLPGIGAGLRAAGFVRVHRMWRQAGGASRLTLAGSR